MPQRLFIWIRYKKQRLARRASCAENLSQKCAMRWICTWTCRWRMSGAARPGKGGKSCRGPHAQESGTKPSRTSTASETPQEWQCELGRGMR